MAEKRNREFAHPGSEAANASTARWEQTPRHHGTRRHRELTQEVFDIGDEVAAYIENLIEAISDYDLALVEDCMEEFDLIVDEARNDVRYVVAELTGVRQALMSGLRGGTVNLVGDRVEPTQAAPERLDAALLLGRYPLPRGIVGVNAHTTALSARTQEVADNLRQLVAFLLDQTLVAARDLGALSLTLLYTRVRAHVELAVQAWIDTVADPYPAFCRSLRGQNPPQFLLERQRIDEVMRRVNAKLAQRQADGSA